MGKVRLRGRSPGLEIYGENDSQSKSGTDKFEKSLERSLGFLPFLDAHEGARIALKWACKIMTFGRRCSG